MNKPSKKVVLGMAGAGVLVILAVMAFFLIPSPSSTKEEKSEKNFFARVWEDVRDERDDTTKTRKRERQSSDDEQGTITAEATIDLSSTDALDVPHQDVREFLGVISGPLQPKDATVSDVTEALQDIGVTSIRNNGYTTDWLDMEGIFNCGGSTYPSWEGCDADDEQYYDWTESDTLMNAIVDGGFEPFLRLGGSVENAERHHDFQGPQNEEQEDNWIVAAIKMADRYESYFTYLDIWTEFPGNFWDRDETSFIKFWAKAYEALKEAFPNKRIGGPGFIAGTTKQVIAGSTKSAAVKFLTELYKSGMKLDWIGWHLFTNDPFEFMQAQSAYEDLLAGVGMYADMPWSGTGFFDDVELMADAYGSSQVEDLEDGTTRELSLEELYNLRNGKQGAALLTASWIALQNTSVSRAYAYRSADAISERGNLEKQPGAFDWFGLIFGDESMTPKPSGNAFRLWSQVVQNYSTLEAISTPEENGTDGVWALYATSSNGNEHALLLSNYSDSSLSITFNLPDGETFCTSTSCELAVVNENEDGKETTAHRSEVLEVDANEVVLVTWSE